MVSEMGERHSGSSAAILVLVLVAGLIVGGIAASYVLLRQINSLESKISNLESQISRISGNEVVYNQTITIYQNATALSEIYDKVKDSVVLISGVTSSGGVQGSGFVYDYNGSMVVITNNHVVHGTTSVSVSFSDGNGYAAVVNGTDAYADLAVLSVPNTSPDEFKPLEIVRSDTLKVGDPVIAVGNPYGLVGSMTTGVISALGRTISEQEYTGGFAIANVIQTSTPINPGNSGGPLLNYDGKVVGITTAIVADSQGLGFAVPSNAILREIFGLIAFGSYDGHSYLGVTGADMDYETAQSMHVNVTYGWKVATVVSGGPAASAGVRANDVIIAINGTRIRNGDEMSSYLEENTLPGETVVVTVVRGNQTLQLSLVLGKRPPPPA
jgi:S1-C subfamily serine protease